MASDPHQMFPVGPLAQHPYHPSYNAWSAPQAQPISVRQYPSTSSAFSASAHPDEDWTKVSDLAERRRIQNRIAQRNYRKKIKERMQFLESKAGGEDGKTGSKKSPKSSNKKSQQQQQQQQQSAHQRRRSSPQPVPTSSVHGQQSLAAPHAIHHNNPFTPPMNPEDSPFFASPSPPVSSSAGSPPPFSAYGSSYSPPGSESGGFYGGGGSHHHHHHHQQHNPVTTWMSSSGLTATAPTLPPMNHFSDAAAYHSGASKGNESMSFAGYGDYSLGVPTATASPYDSNPHTPPMSHTFDLDHSCSSDNNSDAEWSSAYPVTPLSMGSP